MASDDIEYQFVITFSKISNNLCRPVIYSYLWRLKVNLNMKDFAAIDFETANEQRTGVCSVGIVIVRDGDIVDHYYSLIRPEPDSIHRRSAIGCP